MRVAVWFDYFPWSHPVSPAPVLKETILSPVYVLYLCIQISCLYVVGFCFQAVQFCSLELRLLERDWVQSEAAKEKKSGDYIRSENPKNLRVDLTRWKV